MSFFVNPPLASLSGALTPVEAMPHWMQPLTVLNPIRHFGAYQPRGAAERQRPRFALAQFSRAGAFYRDTACPLASGVSANNSDKQ